MFSDLGATVTISANGDFTYDPTTSGFLQALPAGVTVADTWDYQISTTTTFTLPAAQPPSATATAQVGSCGKAGAPPPSCRPGIQGRIDHGTSP